MGSVPRCGPLKTLAVNTFVLMLMANLDDYRLAGSKASLGPK